MSNIRHLIVTTAAGLWLTACTQAEPATDEGAPQTAQEEAGLASVAMTETAGCMEGPVAQFGRYVGDWNIEDSQLGQDGVWSPGAGARWNFTCLGNGVAIQDFWMPNGGGIGTNLRAYNPETGKWEIAWAVAGQPGFAEITAQLDDADNIVMEYVSPIPNPLRRITFFPPTEEGWNWKLEISQDEGATWLEVYRIKATPR